MNHSHAGTPSRSHYVHGCRHEDCRALDRGYKQNWTQTQRSTGRVSPSQTRIYHAAYMRQWRAQRRNTHLQTQEQT